MYMCDTCIFTQLPKYVYLLRCMMFVRSRKVNEQPIKQHGKYLTRGRQLFVVFLATGTRHEPAKATSRRIARSTTRLDYSLLNKKGLLETCDSSGPASTGPSRSNGRATIKGTCLNAILRVSLFRILLHLAMMCLSYYKERISRI